jgi:hypothetical protein
MFLAQMTIDLGVVSSLIKYGLAAVLIAVAFFSFVLPLLRKITIAVPAKLPQLPQDKPTVKPAERNSDSPPPAGFVEHLQIIEATAPNAGPQVWWEYAKAGMTEVEVAKAEAKLARQPVQ